MPPSSRKRTDWLQIGSGKSYWNRTHRPLQCLVFITPLLLYYQIGQAVTHTQAGHGGESVPNLVAFVLMLNFFQFFGAVGTVLPLMAVIAILLAWHLARRDPWDFEPELYGGMAGESVVWGVPFVVIGMAVWRHFSSPMFAGTSGSAGGGLSFQAEVLLSMGAGVYEELLFRLVAINLLSLILMDVFEMKASAAIPIIILSSAILFAAYHLLGSEPFSPAVFAFRTALGVYLAGIYVYRGFGIAVGAHTVYDLIIAWLHAH
jgi:Type II CAAX prenyl endopeptidase Rce1-like